MEKKLNPTSSDQDFIIEHKEITDYGNISVVVNTEWSQQGDFFQKLSTYDQSYMPIKTLGNTTLLPKL